MIGPAGATKTATGLARLGLSALRTLVSRSPWSWTRRSMLGEPLGVWLLAALWLSLGALALTLVT